MITLKNLAASLENRKDEKGFTLIELIIVIAIIGILVAIAIPVYGAIQESSRNRAVEASARDALTAGIAAVSDDEGTNDQTELDDLGTSMSTEKVDVTITLDVAANTVTAQADFVGSDETNTQTGEF